MIENTSTVGFTYDSLGALKAGYKLYMDNFMKLLKRSWITALIYAIAVGAYTTAYVNNMGFIATCFLSLPYFIMVIAMMSQGYSILKEHQETGSIQSCKRWFGGFEFRVFIRLLILLLTVIPIILASALIIIAMTWLTMPLGKMLGIFTCLTTAIIISLFMLPLCYGEYKYVLNKETKISAVFGKYYKKGISHFPAIFGTLFLSSICIVIITSFLQLPQIILMISNTLALQNMMMGDIVILPDYMVWLEPLVFSISGFIQGYLHLFMLYPLYYVYISINNK